jgi:hypothetical protein
VTEEIAVAEAAMAILREGRVIGHCPLETQAAEPPVGQIKVDLLAQPTLGPDAEAVTDEEDADQQFGINRRAACRAIERRKMRSDVAEIDEPVDRAQHVIGRYVSLEAELVEQCVLNDLPLAHHRCVSSLDDAIESLAQQRDKLGVFQQNQTQGGHADFVRGREVLPLLL